MKEYYVTIMSIDPDESGEDNHQKYSYKVLAETPEKAKMIAREKFSDEYGYVIFWMKAE